MSDVRNDHLDIFQGEYAFHLHTSLTDGRLTVDDYFGQAVDLGIERLIFLEHIRREPSYDVEAFIAEIHRAAGTSGVAASIGFEAKVLPGGELDIDERHLELAEVIGIAEHGFPDDPRLLVDSLKTAFDRYASLTANKIVVWVHPGLWFMRKRMLDGMESTYRDLIQNAWDSGLVVEKNLRYRLVPENFLGEDGMRALVTGIDAHSRREVESYAAQRSSSR